MDVVKMDVVKISNTRYDESIQYLHVAYESIAAFSVVCVVNDNNVFKVYTNQNASFAGGNPWVIGIAQNSAEVGDKVEVQYAGMSKVRCYSRNIPVNTNIFLQKNSNGVCCLANENGIETFIKSNGKSIICGYVPPRTEPITGSTLEPREMIVDVWINITTINTPDNIVLKSGTWDYKTEYFYYETDGSRVGPLEFTAKVLVEPLENKFYVVKVLGTQYTTIQNLYKEGQTWILEGRSDMDDREWKFEPSRFSGSDIVALNGSYKAENGILLGLGGKRARCYAKVTAVWIGPPEFA